MSPDRVAAPPRLGAAILRWTLPPGVTGESIKGDLDDEHRALQRSVPGRSFRTWYVGEALKLGARYGALRLVAAVSSFAGRLSGSGGMGLGERLLHEAGQSLRLFWRTPGLALFAVVAMGLGIGATSTMFSVSHGLLRDLPYVEADRLVYVGWSRSGSSDDRVELNAAELLEWRTSQSTLEALAAVRPVSMDLSGGDDPPERVSGAQVTSDAFDALRVRPAMGRGFLPEETASGGPDVVILGHGLWTRRYGGDPEVLGRIVRVNGKDRTVVGIMPEGFRFPELQDLWTPMQVVPDTAAPGEGARLYRAFGRVRAGASVDEARASFGTLGRRLAQAHPQAYGRIAPRVIPYYEYFVGADAVIVMNTLVVIASFVLLIACAAVANLLLSRAVGRSRELAVRSALGASRGRIMSQLLGESLLIAAFGGILGVVVAWSGAELFQRSLADQLPFYWMDCRIDGAVLAFVGVLVLAAGVLAGIVPALRVSRAGASVALRDGGRTASSLRLGRVSRVLVVSEVALSFGLLTTAGMMSKGPFVYGRPEPRFEGTGALTAELSLRRDTYPEAADWSRFSRELLARLDDTPGGQAATLTTSLPGLPSNTTGVQFKDATYAREEDVPPARVGFVAPEFFRTLGVEALEGRLFDERDDANTEAVAIVNRSFAQRFFPGQSALGRQVRTGGHRAGQVIGHAQLEGRPVGCEQLRQAHDLHAGPHPPELREPLQAVLEDRLVDQRAPAGL
ncbi:MAG: FtsX-like permease family protein, partial [Gemmatimonadetes bacterium]|nr:FtsX-like permease family protein [Gemmatimonadota bacterium]